MDGAARWPTLLVNAAARLGLVGDTFEDANVIAGGAFVPARASSDEISELRIDVSEQDTPRWITGLCGFKSIKAAGENFRAERIIEIAE